MSQHCGATLSKGCVNGLVVPGLRLKQIGNPLALWKIFRNPFQGWEDVCPVTQGSAHARNPGLEAG